MTMTKTETTVTLSHRAGIRTRYYGPTDTRGSRIFAWRSDEDSMRKDRNRDDVAMWVQVPYDHALDIAENHAAAVVAYIEKRSKYGDDWAGEWVLSAGTDGYFASWVPGSNR